MKTISLVFLAAGCGGVTVGERPEAWAEGPHAVRPSSTAPSAGAPSSPGAALGGAAAMAPEPAGHIVPAFIDSHVHLAYWPVAEELADGGVAAAVDLAAPERVLDDPAGRGARVIWAGPMVTPPGGYPTRSWGAGGYGAECGGTSECEAVVARLVAAGAGVIKVPVGQGPDHPPEVLSAIVAKAHEAGVRVMAHALSDDGAARAAAAGVDGLAHTPTERLSEATVAAWAMGDRAVISTLSAFGGRPDTVDNLRRMRAAGTTVLYGTDLGNTRTAGIDPAEIRLLQEAGLDGDAIVHAATAAPARFWGIADLGRLGEGAEQSYLVLDADPAAEPASLARPEQVWIDGVRRR